ncbi:hypothetical protein ACB092_08G194700 [Castanea dentata]
MEILGSGRIGKTTLCKIFFISLSFLILPFHWFPFIPPFPLTLIHGGLSSKCRFVRQTASLQFYFESLYSF